MSKKTTNNVAEQIRQMEAAITKANKAVDALIPVTEDASEKIRKGDLKAALHHSESATRYALAEQRLAECYNQYCSFIRKELRKVRFHITSQNVLTITQNAHLDGQTIVVTNSAGKAITPSEDGTYALPYGEAPFSVTISRICGPSACSTKMTIKSSVLHAPPPELAPLVLEVLEVVGYPGSRLFRVESLYLSEIFVRVTDPVRGNCVHDLVYNETTGYHQCRFDMDTGVTYVAQAFGTTIGHTLEHSEQVKFNEAGVFPPDQMLGLDLEPVPGGYSVTAKAPEGSELEIHIGPYDALITREMEHIGNGTYRFVFEPTLRGVDYYAYATGKHPQATLSESPLLKLPKLPMPPKRSSSDSEHKLPIRVQPDGNGGSAITTTAVKGMKMNIFLGPLDALQEFPMHYAGCGMYAYNFAPSESQQDYHAYVCEAGENPIWEQSDLVRLSDQTVVPFPTATPQVISVTPVTEQQLVLYVSNLLDGYLLQSLACEGAKLTLMIGTQELLIPKEMTYEGDGVYSVYYEPPLGCISYYAQVVGEHPEVKLVSSPLEELPKLEVLTEATHA